MAYQSQTLTNFKYQPHPDIAGAGLLAFAGGAVLLLGLLNLFYAIAVIAQAMFLSDVPAVAILLILVDVGVIHALVVYGGGRPLTGYLAGQS
jgi:hypothetical protein